MAPKKVSNPTNYISLVNHFLDFLTVAIHTILYERKIYPQESFISARKFNYPVRQSRHPELCEWINDAIAQVEKQLMQCSVEKICLVLFSPADEPFERFVFDLSNFPVLHRREWYTDFADDEASEIHKLNVVNLEEQFRAVMSKLAYCHRDLEPLPSDCTFNIAIELRDDAEPPITHPQPWVPTVPPLQREKETTDQPLKLGQELGGASTTPIRMVDAGPMSFEMWIEESKVKIGSRDTDVPTDDEMDAVKAVEKGKAPIRQPHTAMNDEEDYDEGFPDQFSQFSFMNMKDG